MDTLANETLTLYCVDLKSISSECGFTQTNYNQASATKMAATVIVTATKPGSNSVVTGAPAETAQSVTTTSSKGAGGPVATLAVGMMMAAMGGPIAFHGM
jgi:hypothetical protein